MWLVNTYSILHLPIDPPSTYSSVHTYIHLHIYPFYGHIHSYIPSCIDQYIYLLIHPPIYYLIWSIHSSVHKFITSYIHTSIHTYTVPLLWSIQKLHTCDVSTYIQSLMQLSMILLYMQITMYSVDVLYSPLPTLVELIVMSILTQRVCLLQT